MSLKDKRLTIRLAFHAAALTLLFMGIVIGRLAGSDDFSGFFGLMLMAYMITLRANPLPRILERRLIQYAECPFAVRSLT